MKKYSRLIFLTFPVFLSLIIGIFANKSVAYIIRLLPSSTGFSIGLYVFVMAVTCLIIGSIIVFRLIGTLLDSHQTRFRLITGSLLIGLGVGWGLSGVSLLTHFF